MRNLTRKRTRTALIVLLALLMTLGVLAFGNGTQAYAADEKSYNVWVGSTQVTSANKDNVLNDKEKTVSFDPATNTLTLHNAKLGTAAFQELDETYYRGIYARDLRLTLNLVWSPGPLQIRTHYC